MKMKTLRRIAVAQKLGHCPWHWDDSNRAALPIHWSSERVTAHFASLALREDRRLRPSEGRPFFSTARKGEVLAAMKAAGWPTPKWRGLWHACRDLQAVDLGRFKYPPYSMYAGG